MDGIFRGLKHWGNIAVVQCVIHAERSSQRELLVWPPGAFLIAGDPYSSLSSTYYGCVGRQWSLFGLNLVGYCGKGPSELPALAPLFDIRRLVLEYG
jgi:hypothetical protein